MLKNLKNLLANDNTKVTAFDLLITAIVVVLCFFTVFYGADFIARKSDYRYNLYFDWELQVPFLIYSFIPYFAIFFLPILIPLYVKKRNELYLLVLRLLIAILVSGIFFIILPCNLGYSQPPLSPELYTLIKTIAGTHNLIPSLHVLLTILIIKSVIVNAQPVVKWLLWLILIILPISTITSHQHHIADVFSGLLFSFIIVRMTKN